MPLSEKDMLTWRGGHEVPDEVLTNSHTLLHRRESLRGMNDNLFTNQVSLIELFDQFRIV